ncbi:MAG: hypothetical protein R2757_12295 [Draconibacterium sp.]
MSMEGMVETSTNLASVKFIGDSRIEVTTSQRSELKPGNIMLLKWWSPFLNWLVLKVSHSDGYPGWTPNPNSSFENYG